MTDTPKGPMTRSRAKAIQDKVNSLLSITQFNLSMDGSLPQADVLCILRYEPGIGTNEVKEDEGDEGDDQGVVVEAAERNEEAEEGKKTRSVWGPVNRPRPVQQKPISFWGPV